jgi:2-succinyl-5-enolpyruvyl-6-hydroxy-3-cyclohexene-1-carboxylate synthase
MSSDPDAAATFCATLVDQWVRDGVTRAMVAPGSRSTPLVLALARHGGMSLEVFHDERCASFAALGASLATGMPAVVLCTSGTAATHFHGAVVEADLSAVPLIVCTADRPPEMRGRGAPQTIDQRRLYGAAARAFFDPGVPRAEDSVSWRRLARDCVATATATGIDAATVPGPVQLNLAFAEPLLGDVLDLPAPLTERFDRVRAARVPGDELDGIARLVSGRTGVVVAGGASGAAALELAEALGWPVIADPRSGAWRDHRCLVHHADAVLRHEATANALAPSVIVRLGAAPASKVLSQWVGRAAAAGAPVVQVDCDARLHDPDSVATHRIVCDLDEACRELAGKVQPAGGGWLEQWRAVSSAARGVIGSDTDWSEPMVARLVVSSLPEGSHLVVSSSMPIRDVEWYAEPRHGLVIHSNRGANGIDGIISTGIGIACATGAPTAVLVGDVAALHDSSALAGLARRDVDLRIVIVDNDGGAIFDFLAQAEHLDPELFERFWGTPHGTSFVALAAAHGVACTEAHDAESLVGALGLRGPHMIVVRSSRPDNVARHRALNAAVADALRA